MSVRPSLERRLAALEQRREAITEDDLLAFGDAVTDEELQRIVDLPEQQEAQLLRELGLDSMALPAHVRDFRRGGARWYFLKPVIEHLRACGWEMPANPT